MDETIEALKRQLVVNDGYPPTLAKACYDSSVLYMLQLRNGTIFYFTEAVFVSSDWVHIRGIEESLITNFSDSGYTFDKGIDIKVFDIAWIADAPDGH